MSRPPYGVVWFKRDLRIADHAPLHEAAKRGPVLCLYVIEPTLWRQPEASTQHFHFLLESLRDLHRALRGIGGQLQIATGDVAEVLARLHADAPFNTLYAHEETGGGWTFGRDRAVSAWCRRQGVAFREFPHSGVVRGLQDRDHWLAHWNRHHRAQCFPVPRLQPVALPWNEPRPPSASNLGLDPHDPPQRQRGGRSEALETLQSFLQERSGGYRGGMSSPLSATTACSRLSAYLAYGCLSLREVVQAAERARADADARRAAGLAAFLSRLHWHDHFIQKLESEPAIEARNMHRGYDGLREEDFHPGHFEALVAGRTGWPMVDACVEMLRHTGWINFRMRAMLVSVAAYPLWLHWRPVGLWLARQFLDYEPGIHWSQMQMQSGTTGINLTRIYNPVKQACDHDPAGQFVRRWLPALRRVPDAWLFEPWRMPSALQSRLGMRVGVDIPVPPVELEPATRLARERLYARRNAADVRALNAAIVERHGSRKRDRRGRPRTPPPPSQGRLPF